MALQPGDVVYFMEGVHDQVYPGFDGDLGPAILVLDSLVNGTALDPITIRNYPGHHAVLDPRGSGMGVLLHHVSHITVKGLEITNAYNRGLGIHSASNIQARNLLVSNTDGTADGNVAGVEIAYSSDCSLSDSIIHDSYDREKARASAQTGNSCNMVLFTNSAAVRRQGGVDRGIRDQDYQGVRGAVRGLGLRIIAAGFRPPL
jgi:hypothetical protein